MTGAVARSDAVAIMGGLVPILWSTGAGSELMQRIAVPMIGGMVSSTALTLIVIPAVYAAIKGWTLPNETHSAGPGKANPEPVPSANTIIPQRTS